MADELGLGARSLYYHEEVLLNGMPVLVYSEIEPPAGDVAPKTALWRGWRSQRGRLLRATRGRSR